MADKFQNTVTIKFKPDGEKDLINAIAKLDKATKTLVNSQAKLVKSNRANRSSLTRMLKTLRASGTDWKKLGLSTKTVTKAYRGNAIAISELKKKYHRFNLTLRKTSSNFARSKKGMLDTEHSTRILGGAFAVLRSKLLLVNFALGLGIRQLAKMVSESAKVQAMETAFNTLTGATEVSSVALTKLKQATNNTMSEFHLFQQANNAMILGVTKNSDEMAEMFDIAQRLGRALGKDTVSSVESLITGIGRQSRLMLDNIGIIVKTDEAYESFAETNNTTVDKLNDTQKKQAFLNATMDSARKKVQTLGTENLTTKDSFDELSASASDLSKELGTTLSPLFEELAKNSSSLFSNLTQLMKIVNHNKSATLLWAEAQDEADGVIKKYSKSLKVTIDSSKSLDQQLRNLQKKVGIGNKGWVELNRVLNNVTETQKNFNKVTGEGEREAALRAEFEAEAKALQAIKDKKIAQQEAFDKETEVRAERNFQIEESAKEQEKRNQREIDNHKAMQDAKESRDDAYYEGVKHAQKALAKEIKATLTDIQNQNDAFHEGIKHTRSELEKEIKTSN